MDDFEKELKVGFLDEAAQLLADAEQCFLQLESEKQDGEILDKIFRLAHNLKGSAKAVGFESMGAFAHVFESFLLKMKTGEIPKISVVINLMLRCNDHLNEMVTTLKADMEAMVDSSELTAELELGLAGNLEKISSKIHIEPEQGIIEEAAQNFEADNYEDIENEAITPDAIPNEMRPQFSQENGSLDSADKKAEHKYKSLLGPTNEESIRVSLSRLEKLLNFVGEMVILQTVLKEQVHSVDQTLLRRTVHQLGKVTKEVQDISMGLRMVPMKPTFQKMQRIVRDIAQVLNKKVTFHMEGEDTELDKTVLESIGDPLVHLVRNAIDHGIEAPERRVALGKSESGNVVLRASHQGGRLVIEISDDGSGIDTKVLRQKAEEKGLLKPGHHISDPEALNLIFHPGFSTKQEITEVSGRGVGMDVVKTNIENLQGEVQVETKVGLGSTFKVFLPLTLAIIDGMVVRCGKERFVLPLAQVHESIQPKKEDVKHHVGLGETLILRGENIPLIRLGVLLGRKNVSPFWQSIAIVIRTGPKPFALLVDDIIGQYQIVIKKLGNELQHYKYFSGSAVLGDGRPALILEPSELALNWSPIAASDIDAKDSPERMTA